MREGGIVRDGAGHDLGEGVTIPVGGPHFESVLGFATVVLEFSTSSAMRRAGLSSLFYADDLFMDGVEQQLQRG